MIPYIEDMVKTFTEHYDTVDISATTASNNLFNTREDAIVIEETQAKIYHFFPKALFATNISRPDIHTTVVLLRTLLRYPENTTVGI